VLLLDDRGTGRSTPITHQTLARLGSPQAQADYLKLFRADAIVQDAELIRRELLSEKGKWAALGQSFGGFCVVRYLSAAAGGLKEAIITGGLPPLDRPVDDIYCLAALQANTVPCAAAVYYDDMYVERIYSEESAAKIRGIKLWVTNEYEHNALRADGERVLDRLLGMLHGEV
jgi:dienelactone hydrolase